jgi:uncharacterized iron-regulated membrane protein
MDQIICGQWSVEAKTQWNRDTSHRKEEASRPRNTASGGQVIALLREAGLLLHNTEAFESLNTGLFSLAANQFPRQTHRRRARKSAFSFTPNTIDGGIKAS